MNARPRVLALAGGVGGAKLALGLSRALGPDELAIVVNTGDDEEFYGLHVSPDLDTVMYTLAGLSNPDTGWGLAGDTFQTLERLKAYGADAWFNLGDRDFATHIRRTDMLRQGYTLSQITESLRRALGVLHPIIPMSDDRVRTMVATDEGELRFQEYFVKRRCEPVVKSLRFDGAERARPSPGFIEALESADLLVMCPSNPFLSIAPILAVPGVRERIEGFDGLRVAVSPIVGGQAIRGPAAKMLRELGHDVSCVGVAKQYVGLCDVFVIDVADTQLRDAISSLGMSVQVTDTVMNADADKERLARHILGLRGVAASRSI
ncbi:MAG: 2-phospho-L-lactate transferase [Chloroflexi bacterium]|nr:2-phospho-L-lactate transferase [Chloroflexota bacterium]